MSFLFLALYDLSRWANKKKDEYDKINNNIK
jgi:hypothetical protein